jgi:hypothetical protein
MRRIAANRSFWCGGEPSECTAFGAVTVNDLGAGLSDSSRSYKNLLFGLPSNPENPYYSNEFGAHLRNPV